MLSSCFLPTPFLYFCASLQTDLFWVGSGIRWTVVDRHCGGRQVGKKEEKAGDRQQAAGRYGVTTRWRRHLKHDAPARTPPFTPRRRTPAAHTLHAMKSAHGWATSWWPESWKGDDGLRPLGPALSHRPVLFLTCPPPVSSFSIYLWLWLLLSSQLM